MSIRLSPNKSANNYKINTKKKGINGNIWIVSKRKNNVFYWKKYSNKKGGTNNLELISNQENLNELLNENNRRYISKRTSINEILIKKIQML